jgi:O-antigen/teichoic acid export membrane protein
MNIYKNGIFYLIIGFLPLLANFLVLPFFTVYLSKTEYGFLAVANIFQSYLTIIIGLGLQGAFSRFYFDYHKKSKLVTSLLTTVLSMTIVAATVIGMIYFVFGDWIFNLLISNSHLFSFSKFGFVIWMSTLLNIIYSIFQVYFRNEENIKAFSLISLGGFFLMISGSFIGVVTFKYGAFGALVGKLIGLAIVIVPFLSYFLVANKVKIRVRLVKPLVKFSYPLIPYLALGIIMNNLDKQLVERYLSIEELGLYNIAFMIGSVPAIFLTAAQSSVYPQIFRALTQNVSDFKEVGKLFNLVLGLSLLIVSLTNAFIPTITKFFIGKEYHDITLYVPILTLAYCFRALYVILILPLEFERKTKYLPIITLSGLGAALLIGPILVSKFQLHGACLTVLAIQISQVAVAAYFTYKIGWLKRDFYFQVPFFIGTIVTLGSTGIVFLFRNGWSDLINFISTGLVIAIFAIQLSKKKSIVNEKN